jgi:hypothetical protein
MSEAEKKRPGLLFKRSLGVKSETIVNLASKVSEAESAKLKETEYRHVTFADIQFWDMQPRKLNLTIDDIFRGEVLSSDEKYPVKKKELDEIIKLAISIKLQDILKPLLVSAKPGKTVLLLGGQRRVMASVFALFHLQDLKTDEDNGIEVIINQEPDFSILDSKLFPANVILQKLDTLTMLKLAGADNGGQVNLNIPEKLNLLIRIADESEANGKKLPWHDLTSTIQVSRSQAFEWLKIVDHRTDPIVKQVIFKVSEENVPINRLFEIVNTQPEERSKMFETWFGKSQEKDIQPNVSLGKTNNLQAIRSLVLANSEGDIYDRLESLDWENPKMAKKGFEEFLKYWVSKHG